MAAAPAEGDLLTAGQVADLLTVSLRTFNRMVAAGEFPPPLRRNRKWVRWTRADLDVYLERLRTGRLGLPAPTVPPAPAPGPDGGAGY